MCHSFLGTIRKHGTVFIIHTTIIIVVIVSVSILALLFLGPERKKGSD